MSTKLNLQTVKNAKTNGARYTLWDSELRGFGLRVNADGTKTYALKYAFHGRQRWHTIGKHGSPWTPETARNEALRLLAQARNGIDPIAADEADKAARTTISELCDLYLAAAHAGKILTKFDEPKKASTLVTDASRIKRHIKPLLGKKRVTDITSEHIEDVLHDVAAGKTAVDERTGKRGRSIVVGGRGAATRTVGLLGALFTFAIKKRLRSDNPVRGVQRFRDRRNERYLSGAEFKRLGEVLAASDAAWRRFEADHDAWIASGRIGAKPQPDAAAENPTATAAVRLLLLTGARKSEVLQLRWEHIDLERGYLRLPSSKTGAKSIPLGSAAVELIGAMPRLAASPYVFPSDRTEKHFVGLSKVWERIRLRAEIPDLRLHDLRHSFASVGASSGSSLLMIGALLGHRDPKTTQRYAHIANDPAKAAADQVAAAVASAMKSSSMGG